MLDTAHLLLPTTFPDIKRESLEILQVNLGYVCNQTCQHCHVNAGPKRTEIMQLDTINQVLDFIDARGIHTIDLTGGAPEMNPHFRYLVEQARERGVQVIDRCNLTILEEPGQEKLARLLAQNGVMVVASLPCYLEENVDNQRGKGVFEASIRGLKRLNDLGYGVEGSSLELNLVYNPQGASLPPSQDELEVSYKQKLLDEYDISFNKLLTITNMPISRFGSMLLSKGEFEGYIQLLKSSYSSCNLQTVMCRNLISIDWQGFVYDCDFNQMLDMPLSDGKKPKLHLDELKEMSLEGLAIKTGEHCYGCTAGQGSSCSGALSE